MKKAKKTDVKHHIVEVASQLFTENGVKNTSLSDISKNCGISKGTLYYYYASKEDIIYDITEVHLNKITQELLSWISDIDNHAAQSKILETVFQKILQAETRGKLHLYLISDAVISNGNLRDRIREKYNEWHKTIETGARIVFKDRDFDHAVLAQMILAMLDGLIIQKMIGVQEMSIESMADIIANTKS